MQVTSGTVMATIIPWPKAFVARNTHEDSVVESELRRWGFWLGLQYASDGYSPMSTLVQLLCGRGSRTGHRILCLDPPARSRFWEINRQVLQLQREQYEVLAARYALPCKPDGQPYSGREIAPFLGVSEPLFWHRLSAARNAYRRLIFSPVLLTRMNDSPSISKTA